jgi:DNA polymerase-3 subunit alpha
LLATALDALGPGGNPVAALSVVGPVMQQIDRLVQLQANSRYPSAFSIGKMLLMLTGEAQGEDVRARIQTVEPLDQAAEKLQKGLRILVSSDRPIESVSKRLEPKGDAEIILVLMVDKDTDVEVKLPGRYKVSPQIASAIKAVPGVEQVELV